MMYNPLIYGKDQTQFIVSVEVHDGYVNLFKELPDGTIKIDQRPNKYWLLSSQQPHKSWIRMNGDLHYKWGKQFTNKKDYLETKYSLRQYDIYSIYDDKESHMINYGTTYFKGLKLKDVSVLSFDIESTTLEHNDNSKVLLISNTFRKGGKVEKKLFSYDDYDEPSEMFKAWCDWVRLVNPSVIVGHNIFAYDLPYINFCANKLGVSLSLGRDNSYIYFDKFESKKRKDQTQDLHYKRAFIYGREIIDTLFLAINYDIATKKYESYALKAIVKTEGLEKKDRTFYDASKIRHHYKNPIEWEKIKEYCKDDSDDALTIFDLMAPSFFYMTQNIPKSFQAVCYTASGSQINSMMCRAYLQNAHSIPKASESIEFEGAISIGNPKIYKNCWKVDVASLYPSIMIQYEVYDKEKDPKALFKELVSTFTELRLEYKKKAKEDKYYDDLQSAFKIFINSCYGFLGAPGLNFNSPENAAFITKRGREILKKAIEWATGKNYENCG